MTTRRSFLQGIGAVAVAAAIPVNYQPQSGKFVVEGQLDAYFTDPNLWEQYTLGEEDFTIEFTIRPHGTMTGRIYHPEVSFIEELPRL